MYNYSYVEKKSAETFANASMIMGVISVFSFLFLPFAIFWAALSIIFAALSRRENYMAGKAKAGIALSAFSVVFGIVATAILISYMINSPAMEEFRKAFQDGYQRGYDYGYNYGYNYFY